MDTLDLALPLTTGIWFTTCDKGYRNGVQTIVQESWNLHNSWTGEIFTILAFGVCMYVTITSLSLTICVSSELSWAELSYAVALANEVKQKRNETQTHRAERCCSSMSSPDSRSCNLDKQHQHHSGSEIHARPCWESCWSHTLVSLINTRWTAACFCAIWIPSIWHHVCWMSFYTSAFRCAFPWDGREAGDACVVMSLSFGCSVKYLI